MSIDEYMKDFAKYLEDIKATEPVRDKLSKLLTVAEKIIPIDEKIESIFISDIKSGETTKFGSVWFFTKSFILESKKFLSKRINLDIVFYPDSIILYEIDSINFDYENEEANTDSQMVITGNFEDVLFEFYATGKNCEYLWDICKNYLIQNLLWYENEDGQ